MPRPATIPARLPLVTPAGLHGFGWRQVPKADARQRGRVVRSTGIQNRPHPFSAEPVYRMGRRAHLEFFMRLRYLLVATGLLTVGLYCLAAPHLPHGLPTDPAPGVTHGIGIGLALLGLRLWTKGRCGSNC